MNHVQASTPAARLRPRGHPLQPAGPGRRRLLLAGLALVLAGCDRVAAPEPADAALAPGQRFPAALLDRFGGGSDAQGPFAGKRLVLNIWATWCPPCRHEMPSLERLSKLLDPARFAVLGLSVDADRQLAAEFLVQQGIAFRNFFDPDGRLSHSLGLKVYPQTFVIAPDRLLQHRIAGQREWDSPTLRNLIQGSPS